MPAPIKPTVSLEVLNQVDVRVGTILAVNDVSGSDKLVQLRVSFGDHERTIVAGMKTERADPQEIVGKQALFVVNLEARKMRGVLSEGMLFDIGYADGVPRPLSSVGGEVLMGGRRRPIVGAVTLDELWVERGPSSDVAAGDEDVPLGEPPVEDGVAGSDPCGGAARHGPVAWAGGTARGAAAPPAVRRASPARKPPRIRLPQIRTGPGGRAAGHRRSGRRGARRVPARPSANHSRRGTRASPRRGG